MPRLDRRAFLAGLTGAPPLLRRSIRSPGMGPSPGRSFEVSWDRRYADGRRANVVVEVDDEEVLVGGRAVTGEHGHVPWIAWLDADGNLRGQRTYRRDGWYEVTATAVPASGGYALLGDGMDGKPCWLLRTDDSGEPRWEYRYPEDDLDGDVFTRDVVAVDDGFVFVGVTVRSNGSESWAIKLDQDGAREWVTRFGGSRYPSPTSVELAGGDVVVTVSTATDHGGRLVRLDRAGEIRDRHRLRNCNPVATTVTSDGYVVAGYGHADQEFDACVEYVENDGEVRWSESFGVDASEMATGISATADGQLYVAGTSRTTSNRDPAHSWIVELDERGERRDLVLFRRGRHTATRSIATVGDGGAVVVGEESRQEYAPGTKTVAWAARVRSGRNDARGSDQSFPTPGTLTAAPPDDGGPRYDDPQIEAPLSWLVVVLGLAGVLVYVRRKRRE